MRCDTSGADYSIYWVDVDGELTVAGHHVTPAWRAALAGKDKLDTFAEASEGITFPVVGCKGPISTVHNLGTPICIKDAASNEAFSRRDLATQYGVESVCFVPCEGGVLEYGTSGTAWKDCSPSCPDMPKKEIRKAFENLGASFVMFWAEKDGEYSVVADYAQQSWRESLRARRGDDKTFCSESRALRLPATGDGPVVTAVHLGVEIHVEVEEAATMQRRELAKEFGIKSLHLMPVPGGVLEAGVSEAARLSGDVLAAALKMRCDNSGAGYAIYWTDVDGMFVVSGDYVTPERRAALHARGMTTSFADASRHLSLSHDSSGPVALCARHGQPTFVADVSTCETMARQGLAAEYGIESICCVPMEGGVLEFGTSVGRETASWSEMPACPDMPKDEMKRAFGERGAVYVIFWQLQGDSYVVGADYVTPEHERAMKNRHGSDTSFAALSRMFALPAGGDGYVARAARSGKEFVIPDAASCEKLSRQKLAQEFGIGEVHIVPCKDGVFEYGAVRRA